MNEREIEKMIAELKKVIEDLKITNQELLKMTKENKVLATK